MFDKRPQGGGEEETWKKKGQKNAYLGQALGFGAYYLSDSVFIHAAAVHTI